MNDEHLDRVVCDADPYRPQYAQGLDVVKQSLLEEIVSAPAVARRPPAARFTVAAVAAAVAGVLALTPLLVHNRDDGLPDVPAPAGSSAATQRVAEQYSRLLIDEPGWTATTVYGFADTSGTVTLAKGALALEIDWYPGDQYESYYTDRLHSSGGSPEPVTVDGWQGNLFRWSTTRFTVMLRPRDGVFVEVSTTSAGWTRTEFDRVRALVRRVDAATWYAALPPQIVTPARAGQAAAKVLADVPLPPGFDVGTLDGLGTNDDYHFIAEVTGHVGCAWIADWVQADKVGDQAAESKAAAALRGSHQWKALKEITRQGDWSHIFWVVADQTAAGRPPAGYQQTLDCESSAGPPAKAPRHQQSPNQ